MYYFLFKYVLCERWPAECHWEINIDESSVRPASHLGYLSETSDWDTGRIITKVNIDEIWYVESQLEPLIQVADLFAGLGVYSRNSFERYKQWLAESNAKNKDLSKSESKKTIRFSAREQERFRVLTYFDQQCKLRKLGESLEAKQGLKTFDPTKPINFWWYEPQSEFDKALCLVAVVSPIE